MVYCYTPNHSATGPQEIFQDFMRYLQADACSVYDCLYESKQIIEVGCMKHARRKFYEARTSDAERSHQALAWINLLYDIEREAKKKRDPTDYEAFVALRHKLRGERSPPIFIVPGQDNCWRNLNTLTNFSGAVSRHQNARDDGNGTEKRPPVLSRNGEISHHLS